MIKIFSGDEDTSFVESFLWAKQDRLGIRCNVDRYSEDGDLIGCKTL